MGAEVEKPRCDQPADHQHERTRNRRRGKPQPENHAKRDQPHQQRRPVSLAQALDPRRQLPPRAVAARRRPRQLRKLTDRDIDRGAGQESRDHRFRQKLRYPPHPQQRKKQEQHARDKGDRRNELRRLVARELGDQHRASSDRSERRARPRRDLPRRTEKRVDDRACSRRVQPVLQRHPGNTCIAKVLRHNQCRNRNPGQQIAAQPATLIPRQPLQNRQHATEASRGPISQALRLRWSWPASGRGGVSCGRR